MARGNPLDPIPHSPRKPLIGNLLSVSGSAPVQDLVNLARENGPIYRLDMMGKPVVVVSGFSLVDELCDEARFDKSTRGALRRLRPSDGVSWFERRLFWNALQNAVRRWSIPGRIKRSTI